jgi:hypothetical protein
MENNPALLDSLTRMPTDEVDATDVGVTVGEAAAADGEAVATTTATSAAGAAVNKCVKCGKRAARDGCTERACLVCCEDVANCDSHRRPRAQQAWREQVLAGTTQVQILAAAKRAHRLAPGRFREAGFAYQGDTVVIWDVRQFARTARWREEAVRKSVRRRRASNISSANDSSNNTAASTAAKNASGGGTNRNPPLRNNRRRFRCMVEQWYQESLHASRSNAP